MFLFTLFLKSEINNSYWELRRLGLFTELIKAACSMFGAWGKATQFSSNGQLVQLRALDWDTTTLLQNYPLLLVYQPSDPKSQFFATLGFPGMVGSITGVSNAKVGVCEKVWLGYEGASSRFGQPFPFVLRDILQFDTTNAAAVQRLQHTARTCAIFVGVGSTSDNRFDAIEYSYPNITVWNMTTQPVYRDHPLIPDIVCM